MNIAEWRGFDKSAARTINRLGERIKALEQALARYGQHDSDCLKLCRPTENVECDCGLDEALAESAKPAKEKL